MERFAIDSATGEVTVAIPLDYETVTEPYVLTVIAEDSGELNAFSVYDTVIMWYIPMCMQLQAVLFGLLQCIPILRVYIHQFTLSSCGFLSMRFISHNYSATSVHDMTYIIVEDTCTNQ